MLMKLDSVKDKSQKRILEHIVYIVILLVFIPVFFYFELFVVCPAIVEEWTLPYFIHNICAMFLLVNIVGNLIYGIFTDTSIKGRVIVGDKNWSVCPVCECLQPPRSWHCDTCNICILKRDHHCTFFASCVGYFNHRYFILFTMYVFVGMVYAFYYNVKFLALRLNWNHGLVVVKFLLPLASFFVDFGEESIYVFLVVMNVIIAAFTGFLFFYHVNNIIQGKTVHETKHSTKEFMYDQGWKHNLIDVLGRRWHLTWISPFIHSPLPGNGIEWIGTDNNKDS